MPATVDNAGTERALLQVGGVCAGVGSVVFAVVRILHGDTPGADAAASLDFVGGRPDYAAVHVVAVIAAFLTLAGLVGAADSFREPVAWALGRLGIVAATVGLAIFAVESTSEGLALPELSRAAASATPDQRPDLV